jgi:hypothetical protein
VRATPGLGSFSQANVLRFAEYNTYGGDEIPVGAVAASTKVNGVESSVDADVGWFIVNALIVPAPVAKAVPTLADVTVCGVATSGVGSPTTNGFDCSVAIIIYPYPDFLAPEVPEKSDPVVYSMLLQRQGYHHKDLQKEVASQTLLTHYIYLELL